MVDTAWKPVEVNVAVADLSAMTDADSTDSEKNGCFMAIAAYGNYLHRHVKEPGDFRDELLIPNEPGRPLVEFCYRNPPPIADHIRKNESLHSVSLLPIKAKMLNLMV